MNHTIDSSVINVFNVGETNITLCLIFIENLVTPNVKNVVLKMRNKYMLIHMQFVSGKNEEQKVCGLIKLLDKHVMFVPLMHYYVMF